MSEEKQPTWQKLMDTAYEKWPEKGGKKQFLEILTPLERAAVLLGNINYQVENGGHDQYVSNGYALSGPRLLTVLAQLIAAPTTNDSAKKVIAEWSDKIAALLRYVDLEAQDHGFCNYYYEDEDGNSEGSEYARSLDDWFYETVQPEFLPAVEAWLVAQVNVCGQIPS